MPGGLVIARSQLASKEWSLGTEPNMLLSELHNPFKHFGLIRV